MPSRITSKKYMAAIGYSNQSFKKPAGHVVITGFIVSTDPWAKVDAYLHEAAGHNIPIDGGIVDIHGYFRWNGRQEWLHNFTLETSVKTNIAASNVYLTIEYEIIKEERKGWW